MSSRLTKLQRILLAEVLETRATDLLWVLSVESPTLISVDDRNRLQEILADEFLDTGIDEVSSEPTDRGLLLEDMIDFFAPYKGDA